MSGSFRHTGILVLGFLLGLASGPANANEIARVDAKRVGHATITKVLINGRQRPALLKSGSPMTVRLEFQSDSSGWCPKCSNQLVVGFAVRAGNRLERLAGGKCIYSASGKKKRQRLGFRMSAPKRPGRYEVVISAPQAYNCTKALRWRAPTVSVGRIRVR